MTPTLRTHFADYAAHHGTPGNKLCHAIGIPVIVLSVLAVLSKVGLFSLGDFTFTLAEALLLGMTFYYLTLDAPLALMMLAVSALLLVPAHLLPLLPALGLFAGGWILQFVGHYVYEKQKPAFFQNFVHLLVGPLWMLAKATRRA
jgi:uncharacterized membrane protein YGL010W